MTHQHPMLPTNQQIAEWDSEYFDGERQNFDFMMIKAFQTGADCQLEQVIEWLEDNVGMLLLDTESEVSHRYLESLEKEFIQDFKEAMRPQQQE